MTKLRYQRYKEQGILNANGFCLDDISDWDMVADIPDDIKSKVVNMFQMNIGWQQVSKAIASEFGQEYAWIAEFMAMHHSSYA